jgi:hypothetical protein
MVEEVGEALHFLLGGLFERIALALHLVAMALHLVATALHIVEQIQALDDSTFLNYVMLLGQLRNGLGITAFNRGGFGSHFFIAPLLVERLALQLLDELLGAHSSPGRLNVEGRAVLNHTKGGGVNRAYGGRKRTGSMSRVGGGYGLSMVSYGSLRSIELFRTAGAVAGRWQRASGVGRERVFCLGSCVIKSKIRIYISLPLGGST